MVHGPFVIIMLALSGAALAQVQPKETSTPADKDFPSTLQPVNPVKYNEPKKAKKQKKVKPVTYDARKDYEERIEKNLKEAEKREKSLEQGEAIDYMKPPYFGHKKPPKIRPIGKRKLCKICGLRH